VVVQKVDWDAAAHLPGLIVSTAQPDDVERGKVIAVGEFFLPSGVTHPLPVKVGDVVLYKKGVGNKVTSYKQAYTVVPARDLIAIESEETP
jgi:chaperonin GroES